MTMKRLSLIASVLTMMLMAATLCMSLAACGEAHKGENTALTTDNSSSPTSFPMDAGNYKFTETCSLMDTFFDDSDLANREAIIEVNNERDTIKAHITSEHISVLGDYTTIDSYASALKGIPAEKIEDGVTGLIYPCEISGQGIDTQEADLIYYVEDSTIHINFEVKTKVKDYIEKYYLEREQ